MSDWTCALCRHESDLQVRPNKATYMVAGTAVCGRHIDDASEVFAPEAKTLAAVLEA